MQEVLGDGTARPVDPVTGQSRYPSKAEIAKCTPNAAQLAQWAAEEEGAVTILVVLSLLFGLVVMVSAP